MAFKFKIQIKRISKPPVWRRLLVPESITFQRFHQIIQAAFGWYSCHLYQFSKTGYGDKEIIGIPEEEDDNPFFQYSKLDSTKIKLSDIFRQVGQKFVYIYDFGDDWTHQITLEDITEHSIINSELLGGKGACPPEDCGGPWGYQNLMDILDDRKHPEHKDMKRWLGLKTSETWDPEAFDLEVRKTIVRRS